MRTQDIRLTGINRAASEQDSVNGGCEELINMRLENGALRPVGRKQKILFPESVSVPSMLRIYIHRIGGTKNYIGVYVSSGNTYVVRLSVASYRYTVSGSPILTISGDANADVDIRFIDNLMIVASGKDSKIRTYSYADGAYTQLPDAFPDVTLSFEKNDTEAGTEIGDGSDFVLEGVKDKYIAAGNVTIEMIYQDIISGISYLRGGRNKNESEGMVGVCVNFTLYDGTETKPSTPQWFCLGGRPQIAFGAITGSGVYNDLHINMRRSSLKTGISTVKVGNTSWDPTLYGVYKDYIKSINIYCTHPVSVTDYWKTFTETHAATVIDDITGQYGWITYTSSSSPGGYSEYTARKRKHPSTPYDFSFDLTDPSEFGKQLFYKQREIPLSKNLSDMQGTFLLDFSEEAMTGDTMSVDNSGYISRYGKMDVYNKRLHLFDTKNTLSIPSPFSTWLYSSQPLTAGELSAISRSSGSVSEVKVMITTKTDNSSVKTLFTGSAFSAIVESTSTSTTLYQYKNGGDSVYCLKSPIAIEVGDYAYGTTTIGPSSIPMEVTAVNREGDTEIWVEGEGPFVYYGTESGTVSTPSGMSLLIRSEAPVIDARDYTADFYVKYVLDGTKYAKFQLTLESSKAYDTAYAYAGGAVFKRLKDLHNPTGAWADATDEVNSFFEIGYVTLTNNSSQSEYDGVTDPGAAVYSETDVVTVSKENNPTFFPPQQSYRIGGNIIGLAVNSQGISDVQIGQYPMDVFTDNGVYAMGLGSGEVVYGSVVKIADDIAANREILPTPFGIVFIQGDGIYLLNGRVAKRISVALDGFVDLDIRKCHQYINAHGRPRWDNLYAWKSMSAESTFPEIMYTDTIVAGELEDNDLYDDYENTLTYVESYDESHDVVVTYPPEAGENGYPYERYAAGDLGNEVPIYDIFYYLLGEDYHQLATSCFSMRDQLKSPSHIHMGYDTYRSELLISDDRLMFTYAYSFLESSWHTITEKWTFFRDNLAMNAGEGMDINDENHNPADVRHIQSRPMKLGSDGFKSIERLIARINVNGPLREENSRMFSMYVYGSRDLRNWYMIGASQYQGYTPLLQIGNTSSRFKAFIITMGGYLTRGSEVSYISSEILDWFNSKLR